MLVIIFNKLCYVYDALLYYKHASSALPIQICPYYISGLVPPGAPSLQSTAFMHTVVRFKT
jgi:hypothetical protein